MGKWVHRLSVDRDGLGTCAECGPIQATWRTGRWKCPVAYSVQRGFRGTQEQKNAANRRRREKFLAAEMQCAICEKVLTAATARVDHIHDHERCEHSSKSDYPYCTECFRGLLCSACNVGLGFYRDRPDLLRRAAEYLEEAHLGGVFLCA